MRPVFILVGVLGLFGHSITWAKPEAFSSIRSGKWEQVDGSSWQRATSSTVAIRIGGREINLAHSLIRDHGNGNRSLRGVSIDGSTHSLVTVGPQGVFGKVSRAGRQWLLSTDRSGTWLLELPERGVTFNACGTAKFNRTRSWSTLQKAGSVENLPQSDTQDAPDTIIDLLVLYNRAMANRYPGDLISTRIDHLVMIANQTFANSGLDVGLRLVGLEFVDYRNGNSNISAILDLTETLAGDVQSGLEALPDYWSATGADLVSLIRPHDIETRGNCGVAAFPDGSPELGVNVVSDGMSSWSLCADDVFTHEVGHNLGAGHQADAGGGGFDPRGAALARQGQYSTVMATFGTGRPDRHLHLPIFSNPDQLCGGLACGDASQADNSAVIRSWAPMVAAHNEGGSLVPAPGLLPPDSALDSDDDGISDWLDAFPFDPLETTDTDGDGVGDHSDHFPSAPDEWVDSDSDGLGDNQDTDDDGDGTLDANDAFPLDSTLAADSDGDGVADAIDAFPDDAGEWRDTDLDGLGNNQDEDDDGDGYPEIDPAGEDLLVVSARNGRILRFDATTGESRGIEVSPGDGLITLQSALAYRPSDQTLLYSADSEVRRLDLLDRNPLGTWVPAYSYNASDPQLGSGFPNGIAIVEAGQRIAIAAASRGAIVQFSGQGRPRQEPPLQGGALPWEEHIDVAAEGDIAYVLGHQTRTLYVEEGGGLRHLAGPVAEWMRNPRRLGVTGDGRLLVSDRARNAVLAVDADSGAFLGVLADLDQAGFERPEGAVVTRDGALLVAAGRDDRILAFDGDSGDFLGERVGFRSGNLRDPRALVLVPRLLDRYPEDPQRVIRPNPGLWFNESTSGRGLDIEVFGNQLSVVWYTYDHAGLPTWYFASGPLEGFTFQSGLLRFTQAPGGNTSFDQVGDLSLNFESERRASMSFSLHGVNESEDLKWLAFDTEPASADHTGLWGRPDGPGWGVTLVTQGQLTVAVAFLFDEEGEPRWVLSDPVSDTNVLEFEMNAFFSDTLCPGCTGESTLQFTSAGTMQVQPIEPLEWSSAIVLPLPMTGDWLMDATPIVRYSEEPVRPR